MYRSLIRNKDHIKYGDEFLGLNANTWTVFPKGSMHIGAPYTDEYVECRRGVVIPKFLRKPTGDPKFICSWCKFWVRGIYCVAENDYHECIKRTKWSAKTKSVRRKAKSKK